jgi:hypothetical protein
VHKLIAILCCILFLSAGNLCAQSDFYDAGNIATIKLKFKESNWKQVLDSLFQNLGTEGRLVGDVSINGHAYKGVGVRYKGFSSWNLDAVKNPFNIELDYSFKDQNHEGFTKIKLSNVIHDPSFLREVLAYEIARKYMPAGRAGYANLYINDSLIGLYSNVEAVDKSFISRHFPSNDNSFFKGDPEQLVYPFGSNANLDYSHGADSLAYVPYYKIESDYGWSKLLRLIYTLSKQSDSIEKYLNTDQALWMHAFNYSLVNLDSYIAYAQNFYIYEDNNSRFNPIVWDLNMSFGSFRHSDASTNFQGLDINETKTLDPLQHLNFSISPRPLMKNLFKNNRYRKSYLAHLRTILKENFINNLYYTRGKELQLLILPYVEQDPNKFYSVTDFKQNLDTTVGGVGSMMQYPGLKDLMDARIAYLQAYSGYQGGPGISEISHFPVHPTYNENCWIKAKVTDADTVILGYRTSSTAIFRKVQMFDDGQHQDGTAGDQVYGAAFTVDGHAIQYYIYADNDSAAQFSPERAEYEFYSIQPAPSAGSLVVNEIMTRNSNTVTDQDGDYDGWIELQNNTNEKINLLNMYLSDDPAFVDKWMFPDTIVEAQKRIIVWADMDNTQLGLHTNFTLNPNGGTILLSNGNYKIVDSVDYQQQVNAISCGRYPNGYGNFDLMKPSFSTVNQIGETWGENCLVYPNPATGLVYITTKNNQSNVSVSLYNASGQLLLEDSFRHFPGEMNSSVDMLDISGLGQGIYLIRVTGENIEYFTRILIN